MRRKLTKWKEVLPKMEHPRNRPNDFQRLVLSCLDAGMTNRDALRIFGISENQLKNIRRKYGDVTTVSDLTYFMKRARDLGADDEVIAIWFGFDRVDKVTSILAQIEK